MNPARIFPILGTLKNYQSSWFKSDVRAGLTVGTILIPQAMAYAALAGVQPVFGLYASLIPLVIYAILASSSKLSVGPVAVSALLIFAGISQVSTPGTAEFLSLVITTGLLIGLLQVLMGIGKLGFLVNFISHPVIAGFTSAAAVIIVISQLKDALGLEMVGSHSCLETLKTTIEHSAEINWPTAIISMGSVAAILLLKKISKRIPGPLIIVVLAILVSYFTGLSKYGIAIIGDIPSGLPSFQLPILNQDLVKLLFPTVFSVTVIGIVESIGIAKALESKHKDHVLNPNQELLALGMAKIGGAFFQSIPTSGSFSRSAINSDNEAKTTVSSLISVLLIVLSLIFLTDVFYYLPKAVLSAIILLAVINLFDIKEAKHLWKTNKKDLMMMVMTFVVTFVLGIELGVLTGVVFSILMVLYSSSKPHMVELGNISGTSYYKDLSRYDNAERLEGVLIMRFDHQLYFGNAAFFKDRILESISESDDEIKYVFLDASHIDAIDSTGMHVLENLDLELKDRGIELHLCEACGPVRDSLYVSGLLKEKDKHHISVQMGVNTINKNTIDETDKINKVANPMQTNKES